MKFYKKDYIDIVQKAEDKSLYACSIVLINGEEILAYTKEIDDGVFYLQDPLRLVRSIEPTTGTPAFMFKRYNTMSDDTTMIIKEASIVTIGYMSDVFVDYYKEAIQTIDKKMKAATKQILNETEEEYWKEFDNAKKPTMLN